MPKLLPMLATCVASLAAQAPSTLAQPSNRTSGANGAAIAQQAARMPSGQIYGPMIQQIATPHNVIAHHVSGIGLITGLMGTGASDSATR